MNSEHRSDYGPEQRKVYVETYGCQMNLADTEIVLGILGKSGYFADSADG